jgi:catechol 2,3-dioxygenase-like lactoylglutathione lyase family enzyme
MPYGIDHIIINVNDYAAAKYFYSWLMPQIGYPRVTTVEDPPPEYSAGFFGARGSFWIRRSDPEFRRDSFHRHRVGLCEIAFAAESRQHIDDLAKQISPHGGHVTDLPREYSYVPGYYAVFFTDPDGMKLELVHIPR